MEILQFKKDLNFEYKDDADLLRQLQMFYTCQGYTPEIRITDEVICIKIDDTVFKTTTRDFEKAMELCNHHDFDKAETLLKRVVEKCPLHADAHRVLAQIEMERGKYEDAYNKNLDALKIDSSNLWALILMGNICAKKNDHSSADIFYHKVLEYHPDNYLALNNVAANYIQQKQYEKAIDILSKLLTQDETYLNTYYGLALSYYKMANLEKAFDVCIQGQKKGVTRPQDRGIREELQKLTMTVAHEIVENCDFSIEVGMEKKKLSEMTDVPLKIETDKSLPIHARLEYYIPHKRNYNRVIYNPSKNYYEHLLMHEFMHLEMYLEASKTSSNKLIVSGKEEQDAFYRWVSAELGKLKTKLTADRLKQFVNQLHEGIMLQAMNSPLDLLVEDRIYNNYPVLRPLQMLSLVEMEIGNVESVKKASKSDIPKKVVNANRIMNIVSSLHLQDLYGFNIAPHYGASPMAMKLANELYDEYKAYRDNYTHGEEYDLMEYFVLTLGLDDFLEMINEMHFNEIKMPDRDDVPKESINPESHDEQNAAFSELHKDGGNPAETMMMSMYMVGALEDLTKRPKFDVQRIAMEIAVVGINGISPEKKGYKIDSIPGRTFDGFEFLAWYYVSWAIAIPEKLDNLGLPFKNAYEAARQLFDKKNNNGDNKK